MTEFVNQNNRTKADPSDRPTGWPVGSDYEVDPFLARRAPEGGADDVFDGDW